MIIGPGEKEVENEASPSRIRLMKTELEVHLEGATTTDLPKLLKIIHGYQGFLKEIHADEDLPSHISLFSEHLLDLDWEKL